MKTFLSRFLLLPPVLLALGVYVWMTKQEAIEPEPRPEAAIPVRVEVVQQASFSPSVSGFGRLEAVGTWSAVSQVQGRIVGMADGLSVGWIAASGTELFKIDRTEYEIERDRSKAALQSAKASLSELGITEADYERTLKIERQILAIDKTDRDRNAALAAKGTSAQTALESAARSYLAQAKTVFDLDANLSRINPQRETLNATVASAMADLQTAQRNIAQTTFVAPFNGRVTEQDASPSQFVRIGDTLVTLEDISASEVVGAFQPIDLGKLIRSSRLDITATRNFAVMSIDSFDVIRQLGLTSKVRLLSDPNDFEWNATLVRTEGAIDTDTGALGIVVRIDNPTRPDTSSRTPPINNGTFVEVILYGPEIENAILLDRNAIRRSPDGSHFVYIVDQSSRLSKASIEIGAIFGSRALVNDGLAVGDQVILSTVQPAIIGTLLFAQENQITADK